MRIAEATDDRREVWTAFVRASPTGSFLQSWEWGEVQRAAGVPITRLTVTEDDMLRAVCLLVHRPLPFKRHYLSAPWGPVLGAAADVAREVSASASAILAALAPALRERLRSGGVFARLEPKLPASAGARAVFAAQGYVFPGRSIQPRDTLVVDLAQSEDDLLRSFHPKTRYNIRVARRQGVTVEAQTTPEGLRTFLALARAVERQGRFHYHPDAYYEAMLATLAPAGMLDILVARRQGVPLAVHLLIRFGDTVTYAHGASSELRRHVMAPHLLQWEGMLRAKAVGLTRYDLFGIAPPGSGVSHPWFGVTRFKRGFGGTEEHYVGAADLVGDPPLYRAYEAGRSLRALLR